MRERMAFLHIPKAAGTSCRHAFAQHFSASETVPWEFGATLLGHHSSLYSVDRPILRDEHADLSGYRYMVGHFALPTITRSFDPSDVVCILREPRTRLLSHYTYWRGWSDGDRALWTPYDIADLALLPLAAFLGSPEAAHQTDNLMTRLLVGDHPLIPVDGMIAERDRAELAQIGVARLDELGFVDVLERGETMFAALEAWFGSPLLSVELNRTDLANGPPLTIDEVTNPQVQELMAERTAIDVLLWKHAATLTAMSVDTVDVLAKRTADASLAKLVQRIQQEAAVDHEATATTATGARPPAPQRLIALIRRGPRAIGERVLAEVRHRREQLAAR